MENFGLALFELLVVEDDVELNKVEGLDEVVDEVAAVDVALVDPVFDAEERPYIVGTANELEAALEEEEVTDLEDVDIDGVNNAEEELDDETGGSSVAGEPPLELEGACVLDDAAAFELPAAFTASLMPYEETTDVVECLR
ncbi:hypothetical protein B0A48_13824 [Cryoendolithus antarcticus]|uniref:Uncharacterized protein n=1 Tax=Cryoendolithus antarcticus TaxID=1507870 RepID=A0A1V8SMT0_9PEZI|nr:hypothetical protein B0A48_13824 [Cryoendolithus antarcticus]